MNNHKFKEWIETVKINLLEKVVLKGEKGKKYKFKATVLVWDPEMDNEWSIISRNGVRYNREKSISSLKTAIEQNNGVPVMYNHLIDGEDADQLGIITDYEDTEAGLIIKGLLNGNKQRVRDEIIPGFLNNVSLQVDGDRETVEEDGKDITYAMPTDFYETSFVPVNGVTGANNIELALAEKVKAGNKLLKEQTSNSKKLFETLTKDDIENELKGIESKFDLTAEHYAAIYKEAFKELYTDPSMEEIQVGMIDSQVAKGIAVEMEHERTYNWLATEIAKGNGLPPLETFARMISEDHVVHENHPRYYDDLEVMENATAVPAPEIIIPLEVEDTNEVQ